MAIAQVQKVASGSGATTVVSYTQSFASSVTPGNLLAAFVYQIATAPALTFSASAGWTLAVSVGEVIPHAKWYYRTAQAGDGAYSMTASMDDGTTTTRWGIALFEYSGIDATPFDQSASTRIGAVTTITSPLTGTTTRADELLLAGIALGNASGGGWGTWSDSFTAEDTDVDARFSTASRIVSATGTYQTGNSWTTARGASIVLATFKGSAAEPTTWHKIVPMRRTHG